jgi:hypothetical protein
MLKHYIKESCERVEPAWYHIMQCPNANKHTIANAKHPKKKY